MNSFIAGLMLAILTEQLAKRQWLAASASFVLFAINAACALTDWLLAPGGKA